MPCKKVKLVLEHKNFFIEFSHSNPPSFILKDNVIRDARVIPQQQHGDVVSTALVISKLPTKTGVETLSPKKSGTGARLQWMEKSKRNRISLQVSLTLAIMILARTILSKLTRRKLMYAHCSAYDCIFLDSAQTAMEEIFQRA